MEGFESEMRAERGSRPVFLTFLCILTFVYTGTSAISNLFSLLTGPMSDEALIDSKVAIAESSAQMRDVGMNGFAESLEKLYRINEATNANHYVFVLSSLLILAIGIFAAIKMFTGVKLGFHLYIIYSLLSVTQLYMFVSASSIPTFLIVTNLIFSLLFVILYAVNLKWLR